MFPETFVAEQVLAYTRPGDLVFDPFCGRGTTVLESLLNNRLAIGLDINPVAACVAGAKAELPSEPYLQRRLDNLEAIFKNETVHQNVPNIFLETCFHPTTLQQLLFLRERLNWRRSTVDRFIAALVLGALHGESHRSERYLSNRMPRTISTKPDYSVRWWNERHLVAPERDAFDILRKAARYRLSVASPRPSGRVLLADARSGGKAFRSYSSQVRLILTSPPYIDTTDYSEDQWLRLWFLGGADRPIARLNKDDRHRQIDRYWTFLMEAWRGCRNLLQDRSIVVVRIGGSTLNKEGLSAGLKKSLALAMPDYSVRSLHRGVTSAIGNKQINSFRPGTSPTREEHDFAFGIKRID
jgi:hypothetical protein